MLELFGILAAAVACREEEIGVGAEEVAVVRDGGVFRGRDNMELVEEAADDGLDTPAVNGEAEADALAVMEFEGGVAVEGFGDGDEAFVGGGGKGLRCPICVAGAREIENHRYGGWRPRGGTAGTVAVKERVAAGGCPIDRGFHPAKPRGIGAMRGERGGRGYLGLA